VDRLISKEVDEAQQWLLSWASGANGDQAADDAIQKDK
jgi:hypothetical protein